jgi:hypothetical protein
VSSAAAAGSSSGRPSFGRAAVRTTSGSMIFLTVRVSGPPSPDERTSTPGIRCHAAASTAERNRGLPDPVTATPSCEALYAIGPPPQARCSGGTYSKVGPAVVRPSPVGSFINATACARSAYIVPTAFRICPGPPVNACSSW